MTKVIKRTINVRNLMQLLAGKNFKNLLTKIAKRYQIIFLLLHLKASVLQSRIAQYIEKTKSYRDMSRRY